MESTKPEEKQDETKFDVRSCLACLGVLVGAPILISIIVGLISLIPEPPPPTPEQRARQEQNERERLLRRAENESTLAEVFCEEPIERHARYGHRWTGGVVFDERFSVVRAAPDNSHVTYIGDKLQFQNGFGAWENMIYECDFDLDDDEVITVRVRPGRL